MTDGDHEDKIVELGRLRKGKLRPKTPPTDPAPDAALSGTEDEVALAFSRRSGDALRHVNLWHQWFRWDGNCWRRIDDLSVFHQVRVIAREFAKEYQDKKLARDAATAAIERAARNDPRHDTPVDVWNISLKTFHTPNRNQHDDHQPGNR